MNLASSLVLATLTLTAGCASSASRSASGRAPAPPAPAALATSSPGERRQVELRHFYLLSPGASATLVVTRSDPADSEHVPEGDVGNLHQGD